jgi:hypothetical protein
MEDSTDALLVLLLVSSGLIAIVFYPLALIGVLFMIIPFYSYQVIKSERKLARIKSNNGAVVNEPINGCIVELALETCM